MKQRKKKYLITYYTQLYNGYIDECQIIVKSRYSAKIIYNDLASKKNTISIEMEEIWWNTQQSTEFQ